MSPGLIILIVLVSLVLGAAITGELIRRRDERRFREWMDRHPEYDENGNKREGQE